MIKVSSFTKFYAMIVSILISLMTLFGFISSESEYYELDQAQREYYEDIIIDTSTDL